MKARTIRRAAAALVLATAATVAGIQLSGVTNQAKAKTTHTTHSQVRVCACLTTRGI